LAQGLHHRLQRREIPLFLQKDDWTWARSARNLRSAPARLPLGSWLLHWRGSWSGTASCTPTWTTAPCITGYAAGLGCDVSDYLALEIAFQGRRANGVEKGLSPGRRWYLFRASVFFSLTYRFGHLQD
jgi:hypothetical protein